MARTVEKIGKQERDVIGQGGNLHTSTMSGELHCTVYRQLQSTGDRANRQSGYNRSFCYFIFVVLEKKNYFVLYKAGQLFSYMSMAGQTR